uniref:Uncharacterized protein n=1 Tax=Eutreptiella gymnastica TaxID=73025 RepID=A0A7S1NV41_9EUGL|mmetsp:Transcript_94907/g.163724  ORF Transcript_94907/g.163724 Transcript_94907/m.163724 type:complete len:128 (+) Transcript_94907:117-500(+)
MPRFAYVNGSVAETVCARLRSVHQLEARLHAGRVVVVQVALYSGMHPDPGVNSESAEEAVSTTSTLSEPLAAQSRSPSPSPSPLDYTTIYSGSMSPSPSGAPRSAQPMAGPAVGLLLLWTATAWAYL